jgi:hypothetical protein
MFYNDAKAAGYSIAEAPAVASDDPDLSKRRRSALAAY